MTPDAALAALRAQADPARATGMAAYHKVVRPYLGVPVPVIDDLARDWRAAITLDERLALAAALWDSNIHEARVAAAKLLTQARIRPDDAGAWGLITSWVPTFDGWALADHASIAGQKRLVADPSRIDTVAGWTTSPHMWTPPCGAGDDPALDETEPPHAGRSGDPRPGAGLGGDVCHRSRLVHPEIRRVVAA